MTGRSLTPWFLAGLIIAGAVLVMPVAGPVAAAADDERQLQTSAKQLDADAGRAASTPDGQRRVTERIAKQFNVEPATVTDLRGRIGGFGQATIALALSQELMKRDPSLTQQAALDQIVAQRQAGKGWGAIARGLDLKLGHVVSEVKKADKAAEQVAGKPEKDSKLAKMDKAQKPEKPEKPAKPSR